MYYLIGGIAVYLFLRLAGISRSGAALIASVWPAFLLCAPLAILAYPVWYIWRIATTD
jgi:hypothetical protein